MLEVMTSAFLGGMVLAGIMMLARLWFMGDR